MVFGSILTDWYLFFSPVLFYVGMLFSSNVNGKVIDTLTPKIKRRNLLAFPLPDTCNHNNAFASFLLCCSLTYSIS